MVWRSSVGRMLALSAVLGTILAAAGARARTAAPLGVEPTIQEGRRLYGVYCSNCHGSEGRGDGPMVSVLLERPADLTRLRRGGEFDRDEIAAAIDGRDTVKGHGRREMPVWGPTFQLAGARDETEVEGRIQSLALYLESIQEPKARAAEEPPRP
jgi:mono/diheme cytochrome c family protein